MEKTPVILAVIIAVISLVVLNFGFRSDGFRERQEISDYQYAKLQTTIELYAEIAKAAREDLKHEVVTVAEYNRIMHQAEILRTKHALQKTAMRDSTR